MLPTGAERTAWSARSSIGVLKSIPTTSPPGPTHRAAISESKPAPQPKSKTVASGLRAAKIATFDTPEKASTTAEGRPSSTEPG